MTNILIIADIHYGPLKESTSHPGYFRQNSINAKNEISNISQYLPKDIDVFINLGDNIRETKNPTTDTNSTKTINSTLSEYFPNIKNIQGNHDIPSSLPFLKKTKIDNNDIFILNPKEINKFSPQEINLLSKEITSNKTFIFTHRPIFPINLDGNFYFDQDQNQYFVNYKDIISRNNIFFISGHTHTLSLNQKYNQITLPSFSENIITSPKPSTHPCIYTIISIDQQKIVFNTFSRQFCFASLEFSV